jgi:hypothetical protein
VLRPAHPWLTSRGADRTLRRTRRSEARRGVTVEPWVSRRDDGVRDGPPELSTRVRFDPVWTRSPTWSLRSWGSASAVALAIAIAAMVAGAAPLFLATLGDEVFRHQVSQMPLSELGITVTVPDAVPDEAALAETSAALEAALPDGVEVGSPTLNLVSSASWRDGWLYRSDDDRGQRARIETGTASEWTEGGRSAVRIAARPELLEAIVPDASGHLPGIWVSDSLATELELTEDAEVLLYLGRRAPPDDGGEAGPRLVAQTRVAGVYPDPWTDGSLAPAWSEVPATVLPRPPGEVGADGGQQLLLADAATVATIAEQAGVELRASWEAPLTPSDVRLTDGGAIARAVVDLERQVAVAGSPLATVVRSLSPERRPPAVSSEMPVALAAARSGQGAVRPQIEGIAASGVALSLGMVVAAGVFVTRRRSTEVTLAWIEGTAPMVVGSRAILEVLPAVALGGVLGWGAALLVALPGSLRRSVESGWAMEAALAALLAAVAGLLGFVVAVAFTAWRIVRGASTSASAGHISALVASVAVATVSGAAVVGRAQLKAPDVLVQLFPVALALSVSLGGALLFERVLARFPLRARSVPLDLALVRVRRSLRSATPLIVAVALAAALVLYAAAVALSLGPATLDKAAVLAGAEARVELQERFSELTRAPEGATVVLRASGTASPGRERVVLLAVDPVELGAATPWGGGFGRAAPSDGLVGLRASGGDELAVLAVGPGHQVGDEVLLGSAGALVRARVVAQQDAFPGMSLSRSTFIVDRDAWLAAAATVAEPSPDGVAATPVDEGLADGFAVELWSRGSPVELATEAERAGYQVTSTDGTSARLGDPRLLSQTISLRFLRLLGAVASVTAIAAIALYVIARQRERHLAFALSRRMGLSASQHTRATAYELMLLLTFAVVLGLAAGITGAVVIVGALDPLPAVPPTVPIVVPIRAAILVFAAGVLLSLIAASFSQHRLQAARTSEVLRVAD